MCLLENSDCNILLRAEPEPFVPVVKVLTLP